MFVFGFLLHIASGSEYYDLANAFIVFSINLNYLNKFKGKNCIIMAERRTLSFSTQQKLRQSDSMLNALWLNTRSCFQEVEFPMRFLYVPMNPIQISGSSIKSAKLWYI